MVIHDDESSGSNKLKEVEKIGIPNPTFIRINEAPSFK